MIEKYIVMDGPDKGRIHDESIAWDLAHAEYDWREENGDQPVLSDSDRSGKPVVLFSDIINMELKRLINDQITEDINSEFERLEVELSQPKFNSIRDILEKEDDATDLKNKRNLELKAKGQAAVRQLAKDFAELMVESGVPGFTFTVDGKKLGAAWLLREYSPSYGPHSVPNGETFDGSDERPGLVILQNGDMHKFWGYSTSAGRSQLSVSEFEQSYRAMSGHGDYLDFDSCGASVIIYFTQIARRHIAGEEIK